MSSPATPVARPLIHRPSSADAGMIAVAIAGVSMSGPLMAATAAPALAIALWRNVFGAVALSPFTVWRNRAEIIGSSRRERLLVLAAGVALAAHFGTWVPSVTMTSVASATALVAVQPVWNALIARASGHSIPRRAWIGIAVALVGVLTLTGLDVTVSGRALTGDALALVGGVFAAIYTSLGGAARRTLSTMTYALTCYTVCAVVLLAGCLVGGVRLGGYPTDAWGKLLLLTLVAQIIGHTLFNRVVKNVGPVVVSLCILFEVPGAALIAAIFLGQVPPLAAIPAALLILGGVALVVSSSTPAPEPVDVD